MLYAVSATSYLRSLPVIRQGKRQINGFRPSIIRCNGYLQFVFSARAKHVHLTEGLAALAVEARVPTICEWPWMATKGCLIGYGPTYVELHGRTADYIVRILRGARAGDLPMEQPVHFGFSINANTARAIGIELPPTILLRADQVIE